MKTLLKHQDFIDVFLELGSSDDLKDTTLTKLEKFTCLLYKKRLASDDDIHKLRYYQLNPNMEDLISENVLNIFFINRETESSREEKNVPCLYNNVKIACLFTRS